MRITQKSLLILMAAAMVWVLCAANAVVAGEKKLPSPDEFVKVEAMPEVVYKASPEYPKEAKKKGVEGVAMIQALVGEKGKVLKAKVHKSSGSELLDKSALAAAQKSTYKPAVQDGKPVAVWVTYKVDFSLEDKPNPAYPAPDEFVAVETMPEMIHQEEPVYPKEAKAKGIEGKVILKALIDTDGNPVKVFVAKSSGEKMLDKAAKMAAMKNQYKPALQNGRPVAIWVAYTVDFTLDEKKKSKSSSG